MPRPFSLSPEQRRQFVEDGFTRVSGAVALDAVEVMAARLWRTLERQLGAVRDQPETWPADEQPELKQMGRSGVFAPMLSPDVRALLDDFFGAHGWSPPRLPPGVLAIRWPTPERSWNVPTRLWHLDFGARHAPWPACVRLFLCLAAVESRGGGTFYVAGSHRVVGAIAPEIGRDHGSARMVRRLRGESPWFAELFSKGEAQPGRVERFMQEGSDLRGLPVRVAEMTGEAGDILVWHPNLLHALSPANRRNTPRLVLSVTIDANPEGEP
jgi:hypothetical protein